ncbi:hypothetical protein EVG20_g2433, partial [Dentipellis fragilis]
PLGPSSPNLAAPPPYSPSFNGVSAAAAKRAPPPPPPLKPKPQPNVQYVVALYDFAAQADGDLDFQTGDRIEVVERTSSAEDWWTGRLNGRTGVFPVEWRAELSYLVSYVYVALDSTQFLFVLSSDVSLASAIVHTACQECATTDLERLLPRLVPNKLRTNSAGSRYSANAWSEASCCLKGLHRGLKSHEVLRDSGLPSPDPSVPGSAPPDGVPLVPPPWDLDAELYLFLDRTIPHSTPSPDSPSVNDDSSILQGLPAGAYNPLEEIHPSALVPIPGVDNRKQYRGNWPQIIVVRYEDSPAGPYDELMYIGGKFENPVEGKGVEAARITNIYVSTNASVWNGRRNWNIPKHLARFEWTPRSGDPYTTTLKVYHHDGVPPPLSADEPFFVATLTRSRLPAVPANTARIPFASRSLRLVQPPLFRGRYPDNGEGPGAAVIGTDDPPHGRTNPWLSITPTYNGWFGLAYIESMKGDGALTDLGDGRSFPRCNPVWVGQRFKGVIHFPASEVVGEASDSEKRK